MNEQEAKKEIAQAKQELLDAKAKLKELNAKLMELSDVMEKSKPRKAGCRKEKKSCFSKVLAKNRLSTAPIMDKIRLALT